MEYIASFGISVAAGVTLIVITALLGHLVQVFSARRIWRLKDPQNVFFCISTTKEETDKYTRLESGLGQIRALAILSPSLIKAYREIDVQRILMSVDEMADRSEHDVILLGGPKNNQRTKALLALVRDVLPVTLEESNEELKEESKITWSENGELHVYPPKKPVEKSDTDKQGPKDNGDEITKGDAVKQGPKDNGDEITKGDAVKQGPKGNGDEITKGDAAKQGLKGNENKITEDYGLIIRIKNPRNPERKVVLLAGIHTFGTTAAARFLVEEMVKAKYLFVHDFAAVVKAGVTDRHVSKPSLVHFAKVSLS